MRAVPQPKKKLEQRGLAPQLRARPQGSKRRTREGLTLIEIMVVAVIIAIAATGASMGLGALTRTSLRSACVRVASLARYAYHRALTQGTTVRLTFDFEDHTFSLTEAHGRITVTRSDSLLRTEGERGTERDGQIRPQKESGAGIDPWEAARLRLEQPDTLVLPPSPFGPLTTPSGATIDRFTKQPIGDDIRLAKVVVAHEADAREEGVVDLFFFPSGLTQHAVVQLVDRNNIIYSVEIHPLSGRTKVYDSPYEPEVLMDDPEARDEQATELEDR